MKLAICSNKKFKFASCFSLEKLFYLEGSEPKCSSMLPQPWFAASKEMECRCDQDGIEDAVPGEKDPPVPIYINQGPLLKSKMENVAVKFKRFVFDLFF